MRPVKLKRDEYRSKRESIGNGKLSGKDPEPIHKAYCIYFIFNHPGHIAIYS